MALEGHLWEKPAVPHALDDEFEDTVLDPAWILSTTQDYATPIDPYLAFGGDPRISIHTDNRRSWLMNQGQSGGFLKTFTLPTNCLIWARMRFDRQSGKATGDQFAVIYIYATTAGVSSATNFIRLWLCEPGTGERVMLDRSQSGVYNEVVGTNGSLATRVKCIEYVMLHKVGSVFHAWCMGQSGEKIYVGSTTHTGDETLDRVGFGLGGARLSPGSPVTGIDFFRVVESATYLP
jgi:hypothetical protein